MAWAARFGFGAMRLGRRGFADVGVPVGRAEYGCIRVLSRYRDHDVYEEARAYLVAEGQEVENVSLF